MGKYRLTKSPFVILNKGGGSNNEKFMEDFNKYCSAYPHTPAIIPECERIIVLGDIHGDYELAKKMLKIAKVINVDNNNIISWIGGKTIVVQVGDQIDRCRPVDSGKFDCSNPAVTLFDEDSDVKILKLFTDLDIDARKSGGMVISLIGNHELMNTQGYLSYVSHKGIKGFDNYIDSKNPDKKFKNGKSARKYAFQPGNEYGMYLGCTRVPSVIIGSNIFVHGGIINQIMDHLDIKGKEDIENINIGVKKWLMGIIDSNDVSNILNVPSEKSLFWTRILGNIEPDKKYDEEKCSSNIDKVLNILKVNNIIIGHTPQSFQFNDGINSTCGNHVWRVDNGSSMAFHYLDKKYIETGHIDPSREPQVLEILNDKTYNILK